MAARNLSVICDPTLSDRCTLVHTGGEGGDDGRAARLHRCPLLNFNAPMSRLDLERFRTAVVVTYCVSTSLISYTAVVTAATADSDVLVPQIFLWSVLSVILVSTLIVVARNPLNGESLWLLAISIVGAVNASITSQIGLDGPFAPITYDLVFVSIFIAPIAGIVGLIRLFR